MARVMRPDPITEMILNLENYLKIWEITEQHYDKVKIE